MSSRADRGPTAETTGPGARPGGRGPRPGLTLSPTHTAAWGQLKEDAGLALRFPRFTGRYRGDKSPTDATTVQEVLDLYPGARPTPTGS